MSKKNTQKAKYVGHDMIQDCFIVNINNTTSEIDKLMKEGDVNGALDLIKQQENRVGIYHPKYPDYIIGRKTVLGKEIPYSKPLSKKALEEFPPSIKGKFNIPIKYSKFKNFNELMNFSYRTQTDIEINMVEIKKMLGNDEDPYQEEITSIMDSSTGKWFIKPKPFPEAKPFKITLENSIESFDYVLLRITKISNNNEIFMSNLEQNTDIHFELIFDLEMNKMNFNFKIDDNSRKSKKTELRYLKFLEQANKGQKLNIISLENDVIMASGILDNVNYSGGFESIHKEILFLEDLLVIEEKYNNIINIPEYINQDDLENIGYLATGIKNGCIKGTWEDSNLNLELNENCIEDLKNTNNDPMSIALVSTREFIIFGQKFEVPKHIINFKSAKYDDIEKIKRKLEVYEKGEIIKLKIVPADNNECEEFFDFTEEPLENLNKFI
jgi:putative abortive phage resistance protein (AbiGii toxin)